MKKHIKNNMNDIDQMLSELSAQPDQDSDEQDTSPKIDITKQNVVQIVDSLFN